MKLKHSSSIVLSVCCLSGVLACGATSPTGATSDQISACKHEGCDKMKFFDCSSASEQAACYADCDKATPNQIDLFTHCAMTSICDPQCRTTIQPADKPATGTGATSSSCTSACDKAVQCSLIKVGEKDACVSECMKSAYQYQIDCVNATACDKIQSNCGGNTSSGGGPDGGGMDQASILECQQDCDGLLFKDCIQAADQAKCRSLCSTVSPDKREAFNGCAFASGADCAKGTACFTQLQAP